MRLRLTELSGAFTIIAPPPASAVLEVNCASVMETVVQPEQYMDPPYYELPF